MRSRLAAGAKRTAGLGLVLALAGGACSPAREQDGAEGGDSTRASAAMAPEFMLQDLEGRTVRLSDFRGKAVVIDFWATWCPPCLFQVPELNAFWKQHRDDGDVVVIGIAVDAEGAAAVGPWVQEQGVEYTIVLGDEGLARRFGVQGFPTLALVAPDGHLESLHVGLVEVAELEQLVAPLRAAAAAPRS